MSEDTAIRPVLTARAKLVAKIASDIVCQMMVRETNGIGQTFAFAPDKPMIQQAVAAAKLLVTEVTEDR